jgi:AraC-like DNA-binding protein
MLVDFQIFLDVIALAQGVILGILLMILSKKPHKSSFFLGLFILFFSLKLVRFIGRNLLLKGDYSELLLLPFNFSWLLFPLFLIYTHQVSVFSNRKIPYWTLIPGLVVIVIQVVTFFLPYETKLALDSHPFHEIFLSNIGILYSWSIAFWNLKLLHQHRIEVRNTFSQVENKELQWARVFLLYSIISSFCIYVLYLISPTNVYLKILYSTLDLITIYWTAFHGISQSNIIALLSNENYNIGFNRKFSAKVNAGTIANVDLENLSKKIESHMKEKKVYTNPYLTIIDLAENLKTHPKRISSTINSLQKQNFNSYINQFRIEKAIEILKNQKLEKYSMEGIGLEVGFNSKSAFYAAFKKKTGTTPTRFKKNLSL